MPIRLASGVYSTCLGLAGGGAIVIAPAQLWLGYSLIAAAILLFVWGIRINDRPWWKAASRRTRRGMIPFADLHRLAPEYGIPLTRFGPAQNNAFHLEGALQQAAVRGRLAVEGRLYRGPAPFNDPLVPIPADHFRAFGFAHGVLGYGASNAQARTGDLDMLVKRMDGLEDVTFYDLHVDRRDALRVIKEFRDDPKIVRS